MGLQGRAPLQKCPVSEHCILVQATVQAHLNEAYRASLSGIGESTLTNWGLWRCAICNWIYATSHTCQGPVCLTLPEAEKKHLHRLRLDPTYLGVDNARI